MHDDKTMRDLFAAHALTAMASQTNIHDAAAMASKAFAIADAMLAERARRDVKRDRYGRIVE